MKYQIGEWVAGTGKLSKYSYQLMSREGESSFDSNLSLNSIQLIGRAWNCRSRKYLGDHWWSPSLSRHDNTGSGTSGDNLQASHNKGQNWTWTPGLPALSSLCTTEGLGIFALVDRTPVVHMMVFGHLRLCFLLVTKTLGIAGRSPCRAKKEYTCEMSTG